MDQSTRHVLILGGGYAGVMAAVRLAGKSRRRNSCVTLVNAIDQFVERPKLHEKATGARLREKPLTRMLEGTGAKFVQGWAAELDPGARRVKVVTESGETWLPYDDLIIALGSRTDRDLIPGVDEHTYTLDPYGRFSTDALKARLASFGDEPFQAVVVGGGATGIEAAAQIKAACPETSVRLLTRGEAGAFKGESIRRHILEALSEQSIHVREDAAVVAVDARSLHLSAEELPADIVIWAGGFTASPLARQAGLQVNRQNQVLIDEYLRSLSHPEIYAIGDAACPVEEPGAPWRMSLFTALVSGAQAADNIIAKHEGRQPGSLSYAWYGQAIALGPADAVGFASYPADAPWRLVFRRKAAVRLRSFFIWYLGGVLEIERRLPGFFFWNGKRRFRKSKLRAIKAQPQDQTNY